MPSNPPDAPDTEEFLVPERSNEELLAIAKGAPKSDSGELERVLKTVRATWWQYGIRKDVEAACVEIENAFERLQNRIAELERMLAGFDVDRVEEEHGITEGQLAALRSENEKLRTVYSVCPECNTSWTNGEVEAEINRLRSTALTPEEADHIAATLADQYDESLRPSLFAKLRSLSSLRSSSLGDTQ